MSKRKISDWTEVRSEIRKHLRRSADVSDGAFRLWDELATGWAWKDPTCFPNLDVLAEALHRHRNTISRLMNELVQLGLVDRTRRNRGYRYTLVTEIPSKFRDPHSNNKQLTQEIRRRKSNESEEPEADVMHQNQCITEPDPGFSSTESEQSDAPKPVHENHSHAPNSVHGDAPKPVHVDEVVQREVVQEERSIRKVKKKRESAIPASQNQGGEGTSPSRFALGDQGTGSINPLVLSSGVAVQSRPTTLASNGSSRRSSSEAQGASVRVDQAHFDPEIDPPALSGPESVLELLRIEVEVKFGKRASEGLPRELTKELRGQITNKILRKYVPHIVQSMIRLLVWDWEVARETCWPFRKDAHIPEPLALVQYAEELSARLGSGFRRPSRSRGKHNTYKNLFIDGRKWVDDSNPF